MYKVYLISCGQKEDKKYKIGYTRKPIIERVKQLKTGNHEELIVEQVFDSKWGSKIEAILHRNYRTQKISGEWFDLSQDQVDKFLVECQNLEHFFEDTLKNSTFNNPKTIINL